MGASGMEGDRVALVTGAAHRVGRAIALELAQAGMTIAVHCHRSVAEARTLVDEIRTLGRPAKVFVTNLAEVDGCQKLIDDVVAWRERLDVLINNASVFRQLSFTGGADRDWEAAWEDAWHINAQAPARLIRHAQRPLAQCRGVVVNILDIAAKQAWPHYAHYGASKAALTWLTRTLAVALAPEVRCVGVAPGIVEFAPAMSLETQQRLLAQVPLGRTTSPEEVAQAVHFLVGARAITGTILVVDGGRLCATGEWAD